MKKSLIIAGLIIIALQISLAKESIIMDAAKAELERTMTELKSQETPPYFLSYTIFESESYKLNASFGKIETDQPTKSRTLDIDLRVGGYKFDNTHIIRGEAFSFGSGFSNTDLPLEDNSEAIRAAIWYASDREYKNALERYEKALTNKAVKVQEEDTSADFSSAEPYKYFEEKPNYKIDTTYWRELVRWASSLLADKDWLYEGSVSFQASITTKNFISSEGAEIQRTEPFFRLFVSAMTKAEDGMTLPLYKSYFSFEPGGLPDRKTIESDVKKIITTLTGLRNAPLMSTYSGPAMLSGEAAGVFFHEIFGHRVEGCRLKDPDDAQTFKNSIGEKILPEFLSVIFDPTTKKLDGIEVSGYYKYDDEGVEAKKVVVVDGGIFKNFLMSRSPIEGFSQSNGHGRKQAGFNAVSRQSNLIVKSDKTLPIDKLKDMLREECRKQDKEYGLLFDKVQGGFTFTGRTIPNSFNVNPLLVYKIYVDGRPDEIVRGVDLIGTPLTTFSNIIETGNDLGVFNGICGAESGGVPVSACSPTLLVSKIEVQKKAKSQAKPPILPSPLLKKKAFINP